MAMTSAWSYSSLKEYKNCARRYHETRVLKNYPREETDATRYGTALHLACEEYIRDNKPLTPEFAFLKPTLDAVAAMPGVKYCEHKMGVRKDGSACEFFDKDVWSRGVADVLIVNEDNFTATVLDYKSGGDKYPDPDQLKLMALMVFAHFPDVRVVKGGLLFVLKNTVTKMRLEAENAASAWMYFRKDVARLERSFETGVWNPQQSGLCRKWCPVKTCEFCGDR